MTETYSLIAFVSGALCGAAGVWMLLRARMRGEAALADSFRALAADTLRANNEAFLQLAETRLKQSEQVAVGALDRKVDAIDHLVKPMNEALTRLNQQVQQVEVKREGAYQSLMEMLRQSSEVQQNLRSETGQLLQALRSSNTRGQWGELQLRRLLEMTGMTAYAKDFSTQVTVDGDGGRQRPDCIINLPNERVIVVDCKVPLNAFLDASSATDDGIRRAALQQHATLVAGHIRALSAKAYWDQFEKTPEFVVMFMPGDHFWAAALEADPKLMDLSIDNKVCVATPMTLVALLRAVAYGWRQEGLAENARKIGQLGGELYAAVATMSDHLSGMGGKLAGAVEGYNKMLGSLERNVLSKARRLRDFGATKDSKLLPEALDPLDVSPRSTAGLLPDARDDAA